MGRTGSSSRVHAAHEVNLRIGAIGAGTQACIRRNVHAARAKATSNRDLYCNVRETVFRFHSAVDARFLVWYRHLDLSLNRDALALALETHPMCGIAGILLHRERTASVQRNTLERMRGSLVHRGPDASATWISENGRAGLAHTRLSIIDLSSSGAQPMVSANGRYRIVFNGEIYNYIELRRELEDDGQLFRGTSDTEVLLELFARKGMGCLEQLDGMFAFAVYDELEHQLWFARDPLGEKPLYIARGDGFVAFSSEARALVASGVASPEPDLSGIAYLLRQGSIPSPLTHLRDVSFIAPGTWHHVDATGRWSHQQRYWAIPFVPESDAVSDPQAAVEQLRESLRLYVPRRGRADVPVGAFLSGGVDSAALCAVLVEAGFSNLQTFTVGLPGHPGDETDRASAIARHLGLPHHQIPLDEVANPHWLGQAIADMDVPSIDGPNTWLVSKAVRESGMKVACSGLGGDELFHGYPSFSRVPLWYRRSAVLRRLGTSRRIEEYIRPCIPAVPRWSRLLEALLSGATVGALWFAKRGLYSAAELRELLTDAAYSQVSKVDPFRRLEALGCPNDISPARQVSFYELSVYMHDQLLRDTDAMSMAHGLEVRSPLIARPLVEFVAKCSAAVQSPVASKFMLRSAVAHLLPPTLLSREKLGFSLDWGRIPRHWSSTSTESARKLFRVRRDSGLPNGVSRSAVIVPRDFAIQALDSALGAVRRMADEQASSSS